MRAGRVACRALAGRHARSAHRGSGQAQDPDWAESALIDDLRWLGLDWDEGPYRQSERTDVYATWVGQLNDAGLTYPCFCTRAELHAAEAPHASDGTPIYPGACRGLTSEQIEERLRTRQRPPATRLVVPDATNPAGTIEFADGTYGLRRECLAEECGDFLVRRSRRRVRLPAGRHRGRRAHGRHPVWLRGRDLLPSTARQIYLQRLLGFPQPEYAHVPMLLAADGSRRLSKRERDCDLGFMREHFGAPEVLLGRLAHLVGLRPTDEPALARDLLDGFSWDAMRAHADDIPVPGSFFC